MSKSYVGMMGCPRCGKETGIVLDQRLRDIFEVGETYAADLCAECKAELELFQSEVAKGGLYWKCKVCHREGVVRYTKNSKDFCETVRRSAFGMEDPEWLTKAVGVEFNNCEEHDGEGEDSDGNHD